MLMQSSASRTWLLLWLSSAEWWIQLSDWMTPMCAYASLCVFPLSVCDFTGLKMKDAFLSEWLACLCMCVCTCVCWFGLCDSAVVKDDGCVWQVSCRWWMAGISLQMLPEFQWLAVAKKYIYYWSISVCNSGDNLNNDKVKSVNDACGETGSEYCK